MDQRQFASALFAVLGVYLAISQLPILVYSAAGLANTNGVPLISVVALFTGMLVVVVIGVALLFFHDRLAERFFPLATERLIVPEAQAVAFSVLGCYFAVEGLSHIAFARISWGLYDWSRVLETALGVALFLGAPQLARLWSRLRVAVTYAPPGDAPSN
jgi:hypothetical protein